MKKFRLTQENGNRYDYDERTRGIEALCNLACARSNASDRAWRVHLDPHAFSRGISVAYEDHGNPDYDMIFHAKASLTTIEG